MWGILFAKRYPNSDNLKLFFEKTTKSANQLLSKFDNIINAGDFNIDTSIKNCNKFKQFADFCHIFESINLVHIKTCFNSGASQSSLTVILTKRPKSFQKAAAITAGLSDYHKRTISTFRSSYTRESLRNTIYRNQKNFNAQDFLNGLET